MTVDAPPPPLSPEDYEALDEYLRTSFDLLEGIASVPEAWTRLTDYLRSPAGRSLDARLIDFLVELFAAKCRRDLRAVQAGEA